MKNVISVKKEIIIHHDDWEETDYEAFLPFSSPIFTMLNITVQIDKRGLYPNRLIYRGEPLDLSKTEVKKQSISFFKVIDFIKEVAFKEGKVEKLLEIQRVLNV